MEAAQAVHRILSPLVAIWLMTLSGAAVGWQLYPRPYLPVMDGPPRGSQPLPFAPPPISPQSLRRLEEELLKALEQQEKILEEFLEAREVLRRRNSAKPIPVSEKTALG